MALTVSFFQDYLHGLDKAKYEADLAEAGDDEAKRKNIQVCLLFFSMACLLRVSSV